MIFLVVVVAAITYFIYHRLNRRSFVELINKMPGPKAIPVFGNTLQYRYDRVEFARQCQGWLDEYGRGGVMRLWNGDSPLVLLTTAESVEHTVWEGASQSSGPNSFCHQDFSPGSFIQASTTPTGGTKWRSRRKMLTPTFHFAILDGFVEIFAEQAKILCHCLSPFSESGKSFDIQPLFGRCSLDIVCETAMGVSVKAQLTNSVYVQAVQRATEIIYRRLRSPWFWPKPMFYAFGDGFKLDSCIRTLKQFTQKVIQERSQKLKSDGLFASNQVSQSAEENSSPRSDANVDPSNAAEDDAEPMSRKSQQRRAFLDLLLLMRDENKLTDEDIREEVDTFMFEGHDSTSTALSWTTFLLGAHQDVQEKVFQEQFSLFGSSDRNPTTEDLKEMKYLECVVKESLRLYPPVPMFTRKVTETFTASGYEIPVGTSVAVLPMAVHRDFNVWGADARQFRPERFLEEHSALSAYRFIPFSAGPRNCIGQKFAMMEEKTVLSTLIRSFAIDSIDKMDSDNAFPVAELVLRPASKILIRLKPRQL